MTSAGTGTLLLVVAAAPLVSQTPHSDAARFLHSFIHLTIVNAHGDTAGESTKLVRAVDVNGAVRVTLNPQALTLYRPAAVANAVGGDTTARRVILQLLDDLADYGKIATALTQSVSQGATAFDSARARARAWYARYRNDVMAFFRHQVLLQDSSTANIDDRAALAADPYIGPQRMGEFARYLRSEFARLVREADQTESGGFGMLSLVAWRITSHGDSVRVGLLGYDTSAAQATTVIPNITTVMTPEENASLQFHRDLAAKVHTVRDLFATAFQDYVAVADEGRRAMTDLVGAFDLLQAWLRSTARRPENLINAVPDSAKAAARRVAADVRQLIDSVSALSGPLQNLREAARSLTSDDRDPMSVLSALSRSLDDITALATRVARVADRVQTLSADLKEFGAKASAVSARDLVLPDTLQQAVTRGTAAYQRLETIARRAAQLIDPGRNVAGVATAFDPAWIARLDLTPRSVATAPETEVLITKAGGDRTDGDLLIFRADLLNADRTPAGKYEWTFRLEKLDLSSRFAAGVGFEGRVFARQNGAEALRPVPVLAWVVRHRSRGESGKGRFWNFLDPSPGVHLVTLSGTTQAVQVGVGLSLNLIQDFVQFGVGRKLQPENADDRYYWYFGLGLFKLAHLSQ